MDIPLTPQQSIEDQYAQGPGTAPPMSNMDVPQQQEMTKEMATQFLNEQLPLMRMQGEYDTLMMQQLTNDVLLNRRPVEQVPGLLGLELKVRQIKAIGVLGQYQQSVQDALNEEQQKVQEKWKDQQTAGFTLSTIENEHSIVAIDVVGVKQGDILTYDKMTGVQIRVNAVIPSPDKTGDYWISYSVVGEGKLDVPVGTKFTALSVTRGEYGSTAE